MVKLLMNSIYRATEGEGQWIGTPQVFVRFQGCAIGCLNCDSMDTWDFSPETAMSLGSILKTVGEESFGGRIKWISITGGDPLHPKHNEGLLTLIVELKKKGHKINIEASGTRLDPVVFDLVDRISFDFKTPSTGVKTSVALLEKLNEQFIGKSQIKSVVADKEDFMAAYEVRMNLAQEGLSWVLTPAYCPGEEFPQDLFQSVIQWNEEAGGLFRVIGQQHKWIHGPDKKQI